MAAGRRPRHQLHLARAACSAPSQRAGERPMFAHEPGRRLRRRRDVPRLRRRLRVLEARGSGQGQVVDAAMVDGSALLLTMVHALRAAGVWSEHAGHQPARQRRPLLRGLRDRRRRPRRGRRDRAAVLRAAAGAAGDRPEARCRSWIARAGRSSSSAWPEVFAGRGTRRSGPTLLEHEEACATVGARAVRGAPGIRTWRPAARSSSSTGSASRRPRRASAARRRSRAEPRAIPRRRSGAGVSSLPER